MYAILEDMNRNYSIGDLFKSGKNDNFFWKPKELLLNIFTQLTT